MGAGPVAGKICKEQEAVTNCRTAVQPEHNLAKRVWIYRQGNLCTGRYFFYMLKKNYLPT